MVSLSAACGSFWYGEQPPEARVALIGAVAIGSEGREMETPQRLPSPEPRFRRDWTCLASALLIVLMLCTVLTIGALWLYTLDHHYM